jgi:hypothetical protein
LQLYQIQTLLFSGFGKGSGGEDANFAKTLEDIKIVLPYQLHINRFKIICQVFYALILATG